MRSNRRGGGCLCIVFVPHFLHSAVDIPMVSADPISGVSRWGEVGRLTHGGRCYPSSCRVWNRDAHGRNLAVREGHPKTEHQHPPAIWASLRVFWHSDHHITQVPKRHSGPGPWKQPDVFMQLFIDASCVCWLTFALGGVAFARFKAIEYHKRFMSLSYAVACTPIMQRVANYFLVFLVVELRLLYEAVISNVPPWEARWGTLPPDASGSSIFLLIGSANHGVSGKTSELVLTFDGYGAGEACVFPLSAWIGLVLALMMGAGMGPSTGTVTAIEDFKEDYGNKYYETTQDLW
eukprot:CAMPEP_0185747986 /NCGR_PEP_ID=MMETSP1174-20130828/6634_1 /TAXON_ID=35687 /ORGANISM="Dictyocha speculum, Strain CCMP1381" /LENGTH=291 /DNA_ID=CAMNT_0028423433 /DNA_START=1 /DNA_END=874 /DNA_ORIENTATION=+